MDSLFELTKYLSPGIFLAIIFSSMLASFFHLWKGGGPFKFVIYCVFSWLGFLLFAWIFQQIELEVLKIGPYDIGAGLIGSVLLLFISDWLAQTRRVEQF